MSSTGRPSTSAQRSTRFGATPIFPRSMRDTAAGVMPTSPATSICVKPLRIRASLILLNVYSHVTMTELFTKKELAVNIFLKVV